MLMQPLHIRSRRTKRNGDEKRRGFYRTVKQFGAAFNCPGHQPDSKTSLVRSTRNGRLPCDEFNRLRTSNADHAQSPCLGNRACQASAPYPCHGRADNRIAQVPGCGQIGMKHTTLLYCNLSISSESAIVSTCGSETPRASMISTLS